MRDVESHRILAYRILHNALFGPMGVESEEFQAFIRGFELAVPDGHKFNEVSNSHTSQHAHLSYRSSYTR